MQTSQDVAKSTASEDVRAFRPADILSWFSADALKWEETARFVANILHQEGPHCRKCRHPFTDVRRRERWFRFERIQCPQCGGFCTAATGTILHKSEFDQREIVLLALFIQLDLTDRKIAEIMRCSSETVRTWRSKFKVLTGGI